MLKVSRGPEIVNELFQFREQISYNLRQRPQFQIPWVFQQYRKPYISWAEGMDKVVPNEMKQLESLKKFRNLHPVLAEYAKDIYRLIDPCKVM